MAVKYKKTGLTLVEMLIVLAIIALLVGLLLPALTTVKNSAKEVKQKTQFGAINLALVTFKNDYGDFPPSSCPVNGNYCGTQQLTEALIGWDLLGFHPKTAWRADGFDSSGGSATYDPLKTRDADKDGTLDTLKERKNLYLDTDTANAFKLFYTLGTETGLYPADDQRKIQKNVGLSDRYVICDVFSMTKVVLPNGKRVSAGSPILYYRANPSKNLINEIYVAQDNDPLVYTKELASAREQPLGRPANSYEYFYNYIRDPKIEAIPQPYRPDSYILISAGSDGIYGTSDDIKNFGE
jgi:prepilin-type N-terminal cleavage/methylation domain-containing protein